MKVEDAFVCLPCRDEDGREGVLATHRLLVREVGETLGYEVWTCPAHLAQFYRSMLSTNIPLDMIVHNMATGRCVMENHPRQMG